MVNKMIGEIICDGLSCRRCSHVNCTKRVRYHDEKKEKPIIRTIKIVECSDHRETYGYLTIENVSVNEVQSKIDEIKNDIEFKHECPEWTIEDVFERFPVEWKWSYVTDDGYTVKI